MLRLTEPENGLIFLKLSFVATFYTGSLISMCSGIWRLCFFHKKEKTRSLTKLQNTYALTNKILLRG